MKTETLKAFILMFSLSMLVALRGDTPDTYAYKTIFEDINTYSFIPSKFYIQTGVEIGYGYLAYLVQLFITSHILLFFIISFLTFYALYKTSKHIGVSYLHLILCYLPSFFIGHQLLQIRQGLASALVYLAIVYSLNLKKINSLVIWVFAISFHTISWAIAWFFLIPKKLICSFQRFVDKHPLVYYFIIITITIIASRFLLQILPSLNDRIGGYSESDMYSTERSPLHPANLRSYLLFVFFLIHSKYFRDNKYYFVFLTLYCIGIGFRVGFYDFLILSGRLGSFFTYTEIFLFPIVISSYKGKLLRLTILLVYFLISMYISLTYQYPDIIKDYLTPLT